MTKKHILIGAAIIVGLYYFNRKAVARTVTGQGAAASNNVSKAVSGVSSGISTAGDTVKAAGGLFDSIKNLFGSSVQPSPSSAPVNNAPAQTNGELTGNSSAASNYSTSSLS